MHLVAGAVSAVIAVLVALYLAVTLSRPLRRIRAGAEAMSAGDLDARVPESGDEEIAAVADALNRLAETLQHEEGLRKENVADLAHELRTPVMGILARVEAAQDGVLDDEAANLSAMHDEALRLTRLLDDISALAEAERPGLLLDAEPVDLAAIAGAQTAAFAGAFADKGVTLSSDLEQAVVGGDPRRLEQIVVNLLSNALRYTDAGGSVRVVVRRDGDEALLEVADTGIGIAAEDLPHVFTRFWRGEKSRSRDTGGAGIGLSIVKELVQAHGRHDLGRQRARRAAPCSASCCPCHPSSGLTPDEIVPRTDAARCRQAASGCSAARSRFRTSREQSRRDDIAISSRCSCSCSST